MPTLLILGGTREAVELAQKLSAHFTVVYALAGVTQSPRLPAQCRVLSGGFGGAQGLARWLRRNPCVAVIDATHPFATTISRSTIQACSAPLYRLERPISMANSNAYPAVHTEAQALQLAATFARRPCITLGRRFLDTHKHLQALNRWARFVVIRTAEPLAPPAALTVPHLFIASKGPISPEHEQDLYRRHGIDALITRISGGSATAIKLAAAAACRVPVLPILPRGDEHIAGHAFASTEDLYAHVMGLPALKRA